MDGKDYAAAGNGIEILKEASMLILRVKLNDYDVILINSSAGKDSQTMLDVLVEQADKEGVNRNRLVVVHADLGIAEWQGTADLAERQAKHYGLRFIKMARPQGDLLSHIEKRLEAVKGRAIRLRSGNLTDSDRRFVAKQAKKAEEFGPRIDDASFNANLAKMDEDNPIWPDSLNRYCTSDHKRGQVGKIITMLHRESGKSTFRILNCLGIRSQESTPRSKKVPFVNDVRNSTKLRHVDIYYPIFEMKVDEVWERIRTSGVEYHKAYDFGMQRLSCVFCVFAPKCMLKIAAKHNADLLDRYINLEEKIGHTFRKDFSIAELKNPDAVLTEDIKEWSM